MACAWIAGAPGGVVRACAGLIVASAGVAGGYSGTLCVVFSGRLLAGATTHFGDGDRVSEVR